MQDINQLGRNMQSMFDKLNTCLSQMERDIEKTTLAIRILKAKLEENNG